MTDEQAVSAAEREVWEALLTGNAEADAALLSADFLGVYPDGFADKQAHATQLAEGPTVQSYEIDEERFLPLGPDHVLISYRARYTRVRCGTTGVMFVSSIWKRQGGRWVGLFSQDTPKVTQDVS